jgi:hypothetical protein
MTYIKQHVKSYKHKHEPVHEYHRNENHVPPHKQHLHGELVDFKAYDRKENDVPEYTHDKRWVKGYNRSVLGKKIYKAVSKNKNNHRNSKLKWWKVNSLPRAKK